MDRCSPELLNDDRVDNGDCVESNEQEGGNVAVLRGMSVDSRGVWLDAGSV